LEVLVSSGYRRQAPQPIAHTWEVAVLALTGIATTVGAAALAGQAAVVAVTGGGWVWPAGSHAATRAVAGLASGRPGAGLTAEQAQRLPAGWVVYAGVGAGEVTAVALLVAAALFGRRWWRPNDPSQGMATRGQAAAVLGVRRLRSARSILRPDLYPPRSSARTDPAAATAQQEASSGGRGRRAAGALTSPGRPGQRARRWVRPGRDPSLLGWRLGRSRRPYGVQLWVRYDRTAGVFGAQGSGKTLDLLAPALLAHPGPAMATLTKPEDLLLTVERRRGKGPVAVLDPFGTAPGLPELVWDPVAGCVYPKFAERRA
jgi:type IV secretion system protein VirD4